MAAGIGGLVDSTTNDVNSYRPASVVDVQARHTVVATHRFRVHEGPESTGVHRVPLYVWSTPPMGLKAPAEAMRRQLGQRSLPGEALA